MNSLTRIVLHGLGLFASGVCVGAAIGGATRIAGVAVLLGVTLSAIGSFWPRRAA